MNSELLLGSAGGVERGQRGVRHVRVNGALG